NLAHAVLLAVDQPEAAAGKVFNCGDEEVLSIRQVVELVADALDHAFEIVSMPYELAIPARPLLAQPLPTHRVLDLGRLRGDLARWVGVMVRGMSALFLICNRGKRSIVVDLDTHEGRDVARRLAAGVDVVIENFRPGVMDRLGLGYDALRAANPSLVYASLS